MAPSGVAQNLASVKWGTVLKFTATEAKKYAHGLTVNRGNTIIKKVECLKKTSYDFYPYMTKAGSYIFKVRTVPGTETEKKYGKKSEWTESAEAYLTEENVSDGSVQDGSWNSNLEVGWIRDGNTGIICTLMVPIKNPGQI